MPTQVVSSDEFMPVPQTERQKKVEARMNALADEYGKKNGLSRRRFFQTAAGMTTAFVAMNEIYGPLYGASPAEAKNVDLAQARADGLKDQFIMDVHTHFLRDDTRLEGFVRGREAVGKAGWNPELVDKPQTIDDLKYPNWFKEVFLDSDTKVALISGSASEDPRDWFLTNEMKAEARAKVNAAAGSKRLLSHAIFTPGYDGWMDEVDKCIATLKPDLVEGLHGRRQHQQGPGAPSLAHGRREAGLSLLREDREGGLRHRLRAQGPLSDLGREALAASHALRHGRRCRQGGQGLAEHPLRDLSLGLPLDRRARRVGRGLRPVREDRPHRMDDRPRRDPGQVWRQQRLRRSRPDLRPDHGDRTAPVRRPDGPARQGHGRRPCRGGTDAVWTGAPQWQIEGLRRLEIPDDMRKKFGFAELGPADGPVKRAIFGENSAKMYRYEVKKAAWRDDRFAALKTDYERRGRDPSNLRYGFVAPHDGAASFAASRTRRMQEIASRLTLTSSPGRGI